MRIFMVFSHAIDRQSPVTPHGRGASGVARICIWRGLGARPTLPEAVLAVGHPPPGRGFGGITPEKILEI